MFDDIINKRKGKRTIKCVVTGDIRYLIDGKDKCGSLVKFADGTYGCSKFMTLFDTPDKGWCGENVVESS